MWSDDGFVIRLPDSEDGDFDSAWFLPTAPEMRDLVCANSAAPRSSQPSSARPPDARCCCRNAAPAAPGQTPMSGRQQQTGTGPRPSSVSAIDGGQRYMPQPQRAPRHAPQNVYGVIAAATRGGAAPAAAVTKPWQEGYVFSMGFTPAAPTPAPGPPAVYRPQPSVRDTAAAVGAAPQRSAQHAPVVPKQMRSTIPRAGQPPAGGGPDAAALRTTSGTSGSRTRRAAISPTDGLLLCPITQVSFMEFYLRRILLLMCTNWRGATSAPSPPTNALLYSFRLFTLSTALVVGCL